MKRHRTNECTRSPSLTFQVQNSKNKWIFFFASVQTDKSGGFTVPSLIFGSERSVDLPVFAMNDVSHFGN